MSFASGKDALAICDRCGKDCDYRELREESIRGIPQGNAVCGDCWDADHPQNWFGQDTVVDYEGLQDPRPEPDISQIRSLAGFNPVGATGDCLVLRSGSVSVAL